MGFQVFGGMALLVVVIAGVSYGLWRIWFHGYSLGLQHHYIRLKDVSEVAEGAAKVAAQRELARESMRSGYGLPTRSGRLLKPVTARMQREVQKGMINDDDDGGESDEST